MLLIKTMILSVNENVDAIGKYEDYLIVLGSRIDVL